MNKTNPWVAGVLGISLAGAMLLNCQGADADTGQTATISSVPADVASDTPQKLLADLQQYRQDSSSLAPEASAQQWLFLAERVGKLPANSKKENQVDLGDVIAALPPPADWHALVKLAEGRPIGHGNAGAQTALLHLLFHFITGNHSAQSLDRKYLNELAMRDGVAISSEFYAEPAAEPAPAPKDSATILRDFQTKLDQLSDKTRKPREDLLFDVLEVPDLVSLAGGEQASSLLRGALLLPRVSLAVHTGSATQSLAEKLALEMMQELQTPQWDITCSLHGTKLFEAMEKRFPNREVEENIFDGAGNYYLLGLLAAHRTDDAIRFAARSRTDVYGGHLSGSWDTPQLPDLAGFYHQALQKHPAIPFWNDYAEIAGKLGKTEEFIATAESALKHKELSGDSRELIEEKLQAAYFATDKIDQGIEMLRKQITTDSQRRLTDEDPPALPSELGPQLATLGLLLERPKLQDEGIRTYQAALQRAVTETPSRDLSDQYLKLADLLADCGRTPQAETTLLAADKAAKSVNPEWRDRRPLIRLMALYHDTNRPADILALLDNNPGWGATDLSGIYTDPISTHRNTEYAGYYAAWALDASGRPVDALKIVNALLDQAGVYDPAFDLLLQLAPDLAATRLDALFARDPYEERPLLWKAKLLFSQGKREEAEATARQALAVDPSDGDQEPGRRLRVYSVLADIREARGDAREAATLRDAVAAIRLSERADRFYQAGLTTRAIRMYEEALAHFAGAYFIESRVADALSQLGKNAEAEEHYRKSFALMPDSFGRMESPSFGCGPSFGEEPSQDAAEKIFIQLAAMRPLQPQEHYLLGYLRFDQRRYREAMLELQAAACLDPAYLNAWNGLWEVSQWASFPAEYRQTVLLNMLKLDPSARHTRFSANEVEDWRPFWPELEKSFSLHAAKPDTLYPLSASAATLAKVRPEDSAIWQRPKYSSKMPGAAPPGEILAGSDVVERLASNYDQLRPSSEGK